MAKDRDYDDYDDGTRAGEPGRRRDRHFDDDDEETRPGEPDRHRGREYDDITDRIRRREDIPNYLTQSIFVTICCCTIGGIIAIVNAAQVNGKLATGDAEGALRASNQAKMWCWISFAVGLITTPLIVYLQILADNRGFR